MGQEKWEAMQEYLSLWEKHWSIISRPLMMTFYRTLRSEGKK